MQSQATTATKQLVSMLVIWRVVWRMLVLGAVATGCAQQTVRTGVHLNPGSTAVLTMDPGESARVRIENHGPGTLRVTQTDSQDRVVKTIELPTAGVAEMGWSRIHTITLQNTAGGESTASVHFQGGKFFDLNVSDGTSTMIRASQ